MAKHDGYTSSQAWPQTQNQTNGQMVLKQSRSLGILALALAPADEGSPHYIILIQAGSMIARNDNALVGEFVTHIDTISTTTINYSELHRALQDPEFSVVSLDVADLQGNAQTISVLRSPPKTCQISWA